MNCYTNRPTFCPHQGTGPARHGNHPQRKDVLFEEPRANALRLVEARGEIWLSLHTGSESVAKVKAPMIWAEQIEAWEAKLGGDTLEAEQRFAAAQRLAEVRGHRYLTAKKVAELPREELLQRI